MHEAVVGIVAEWYPDPDTGPRRVASGEGVLPECRVDDLPVLVTWASNASPPVEGAHARLLSAFRAVAGPEAILVVVQHEGGDGWLRVDAQFAGEQRRAAFMAAAVVKAAWGWDENERIRVEDANGSLVIALRLDPEAKAFRVSVDDVEARA